MNKDIRLSVGFLDNYKTIKLQRRLGDKGVLSLLQLWLWVAQNRPDGTLTGMDPEEIEIVARWGNTEEESFFEVIKELTLLDIVCHNGVDTYVIHDWREHNEWQADAMKRSDAARLSRLAKVDKQTYVALKKAGIEGISKEYYEKLSMSNDRLTFVEQSLTSPVSPFLTFPFTTEIENTSFAPRARHKLHTISGPIAPQFGVENNKQFIKKDITIHNQLISEYTGNPQLQKTISSFISMRQRIGRPITSEGLSLIFQELNELAERDDISKQAILEQSIKASYPNIYPVKRKNSQCSTTSRDSNSVLQKNMETAARVLSNREQRKEANEAIR